jgi:hypothetical protein
MNRDQKKALKRIDDKIAKAKERGNYIETVRWMQEREKLFALERTEVRTTLKEALKDHTPEERREATVEVIYAVAVADLLYGATMDVESTLRKKFGIGGLPMMEELRSIVKKLQQTVKTIDDVGSQLFSYNYAEIVEGIETKVEATIKNYIHNEIQRSAKRDMI